MTQVVGITLGVILFVVVILVTCSKSDGRDWPVG